VAEQSRDGQVGADDRELDSGVIPQFRQGDIFRALCDLLPGEALFACPLVTLDGVKVIDVVWIGPEYAARLESAKIQWLWRARSGNLRRSALTVQLQARNGREARPLL